MLGKKTCCEILSLIASVRSALLKKKNWVESSFVGTELCGTKRLKKNSRIVGYKRKATRGGAQQKREEESEGSLVLGKEKQGSWVSSSLHLFPSSLPPILHVLQRATPLSNGTAYQSVPERYILPVDERPGSSPAVACKALPVIDLEGEDHDMIVQQIVDAGKEFGFFQIVNHGVPQQLMDDMFGVGEQFFNLPTEDKMLYYSTDLSKLPLFHTGLSSGEKNVLYWSDSLKLGCYPLENFRHECPEKPHKFREVFKEYMVAVRAMALRLLRLIAIGLGLKEGSFDGQLSVGRMMTSVNHFVPCPDPSLTLGLPGHCDAGLVTVLMQSEVSGLQVLYKGDWLGVEPIRGAFVVNFGHQLEIVSNGMMKSAEHRVVTNMSTARTSLATFIQPAMDCIVAPAPALVDDDHPPLCKSFCYQEFLKVFLSHGGDRKATLGAFQIIK